RWERRRAGAYRAQVAFERGVIVFALEREGRVWALRAHGPAGARALATDLRTMREGRDLAQRVADLRARREAQTQTQTQTQALVRWREALRSEAKWRAALRREAQAWVSSECSTWECAPCSCESSTQAQAQAQAQ